jgi:hypothetical protein
MALPWVACSLLESSLSLHGGLDHPTQVSNSLSEEYSFSYDVPLTFFLGGPSVPCERLLREFLAKVAKGAKKELKIIYRNTNDLLEVLNIYIYSLASLAYFARDF